MTPPLALITGASRGIGAATAKLIANQGITVIINYHKNLAAALIVQNDILQNNGQAVIMQADVSDEAQVHAMFEQIDQLDGQLKYLVNNAGIINKQTTVEQMTATRINQLLTTNVTSYFICAKQAIKRMAKRHGGLGGSIVNVSSAASRLGAPFEYIDYAASKGAIDSFTTGLSQEIAADGIRVNGVRPGLIYTDIHADGGEASRVDRIAPNLPLQRGGTPDEVAQAIWWLLSDNASYVTGAHIDIAGGR